MKIPFKCNKKQVDWSFETKLTTGRSLRCNVTENLKMGLFISDCLPVVPTPLWLLRNFVLRGNFGPSSRIQGPFFDILWRWGWTTPSIQKWISDFLFAPYRLRNYWNDRYKKSIWVLGLQMVLMIVSEPPPPPLKGGIPYIWK